MSSNAKFVRSQQQQSSPWDFASWILKKQLIKEQQKELSLMFPMIDNENKNGTENKNEKSDNNEEGELHDGILDVWSWNFEHALSMIEKLLSENFKLVSLNTAFAGICVRPCDQISSVVRYHYELVALNTNVVSVLQLAISLFNEQSGNRPSPVHTFQFNFRFDIISQISDCSAIEILSEAGMDFRRMKTQEGIKHSRFATDFLMSGLFLMADIHWIVFHGIFDVAHVVQLMRGQPMSASNPKDFFLFYKLFFPNLTDLKTVYEYIANDVQCTPALDRKMGIDQLCEQMKIEREGTKHLAGSGSISRGKLYFQLKSEFAKAMEKCEKDAEVKGVLYGFTRRGASKRDPLAKYFGYMVD